MKILIANDHRGLKIKNELVKYLEKNNYAVENLGTNSEKAVNYPTLAFKLSKKLSNDDLGILICGTGIGMSIAANKVKGVRCAKVNSVKEAELSRLHNNANVLALSSSNSIFKVKKIVKKFIETEYTNEKRHDKRLSLIEEYERDNYA